MVGSTGIGLADSGVQLSPGVKTLLEIGKLVEVRGRTVEITQDGFAFLLQDVNAQVWTMLILYLQNAEAVSPQPHNLTLDVFFLTLSPSNCWSAQYG